MKRKSKIDKNQKKCNLSLSKKQDLSQKKLKLMSSRNEPSENIMSSNTINCPINKSYQNTQKKLFDMKNNIYPNKLILTEDINIEKYENNFDENALNCILMQITQNLNFQNKKINIINNEDNFKNSKNKILKDTKFQYDLSLFKIIQIEISYMKMESKVEERIERTICDYFTKNPFEYYSFSNSRNILTAPTTSEDQTAYEGMFQNDCVNGKIKNKLDILKSFRHINYISSMKSLIRQCKTKNKYFYLTSPMYTLYFDSNSITKAKNYKEDKTDYYAILSKKTTLESILNNNNNIINFEPCFKTENIRNSNDEVINNNNDEIISNDNNIITPYKFDYINSCILFNTIVNEFENKYFNIFSPVYFEESVYHQCKYNIKKLKKLENNIIDINIYGIIFEEEVKNFIKFLKDKKVFDEHIIIDVSIKFTRISSTNNFFLINKKLKGNIIKVEFNNKDSDFSLTVKE